MTVLVVLAAWFLAGVLATLVLGPRLRRAAEQAGAALEPEPLLVGNRSPLRWRVGTLGVVGLLAGSTGMAAAGALPGSAQTIAHHVLSTVGVHVPEAPPAVEVASPAATPWDDRSSGAPPPSTSATPDVPPGSDPPPPAAGEGPSPSDAVASGGDEVATGPSSRGSGAVSTTQPPPPVELSEPSDVGSDPGVRREEPSDVPPDPPAEDPPPTTTTTTPPEEAPPTTAPPEDPASGGTTTTTVPGDAGTAPPAG